MQLKRSIAATKWLFLVTGATGRFVVKNPRVLPRTILWGISNLGMLPRKIAHKTDLRKPRENIQNDLKKCQTLFERNEALRNSSDLNLLQNNYRVYGITRWGLLYTLLRAIKGKKVIETGVAEGESTSHILQALADNGGGILHSIDFPNQFYITDAGEVHAEFNPPDVDPGCLVPQTLKKYWRLTLGSSYDKLPKVLAKEGEIDVFFHDSEHTAEVMTFEYETAWPHIRRGGYLVTDDASWNSAFKDFAGKYNIEPVVIEGNNFSIGFIKKP